MKWSFLLFILVPNYLFAETKGEFVESRRTDYRIDWKYFAGKYLIYDCERKHYACVNLEGNANCLQERKFAIEKKTNMYPCAPLASFADKKKCAEKNYDVVDINAPKRFCYPK